VRFYAEACAKVLENLSGISARLAKRGGKGLVFAFVEARFFLLDSIRAPKIESEAVPFKVSGAVFGMPFIGEIEYPLYEIEVYRSLAPPG